MERRLFSSLFPFFLLLVAAFPAVADDPGPVVFETSRLAIDGAGIDGAGRHHSFTVELALTARQRARGLMFRKRLGDDAGMLFLYEGEARRTMWMKNTMVPLDMLFFDKEGRILRIEHAATPYSRRPISSGGAARGVLELSGGTARGLGIVAGDIIVHPLLQAAAE